MDYKNLNNSTLKQGLIELHKLGRIDRPTIEALMKEVDKHPQALKEADELVANKAYNEQKITYYQSPVFNSCNADLKLSPSAYKLLGIMKQSMSQQNIVRIDRKICSDIIGVQKRQLVNLINELIKHHMIVIAKPKSGPHPPEYMVNPRLGYIGRHQKALIKRFWTYVGIPEKQIHEEDEAFLKSKYENLITGTDFTKDDPKATCGFIRQTTKKEESQDGNPNDSPM